MRVCNYLNEANSFILMVFFPVQLVKILWINVAAATTVNGLFYCLLIFPTIRYLFPTRFPSL